MRTLLATAAIALAGGLATPAHAVVCTGTTLNVGSGGTATGAFLLGTGNCVAVSDKVFGEFTASGSITGDGSASFTFLNNPGNVTLGFSGVVGPSTVGTIDYTVAVDPALSQGFLIDDLEKDITFNAADPLGGPAVVNLTGLVSPSGTTFACTRSSPPAVTDNCPITHTFAPIDEIDVSQTITTNPNAVVTALTDTISQVAPVSEPGSLALLGTGLLGLIVGHRWMRRRKDDDTGCRAATS